MYSDGVHSYVTWNVHRAIKFDTVNLYSYIKSKLPEYFVESW
jgi:hypothetical protein